MGSRYSGWFGALAGLGMAAGLALAQHAVDAVAGTETVEIDADTARLYRLEMESSCWHVPIPDAEIDELVHRLVVQYHVNALVAIIRNAPPNTGVTTNLGGEGDRPVVFLVQLQEKDPVSRWLVLHETSHVIAVSYGYHGHGSEFRRILAALVEQEIDPACAFDFRRRLADPRS